MTTPPPPLTERGFARWQGKKDEETLGVAVVTVSAGATP
jgi:hypothetical protein